VPSELHRLLERADFLKNWLPDLKGKF